MSRYDAYDAEARGILREAQRRVRARGGTVLMPEDLVWGAMLASGELLQDVAKKSGVRLDADKLEAERQRIETSLAGAEQHSGRLELDDAVRQVFCDAEQLADRSGGLVGPVHLLHAMRSILQSKLPDFVALSGTITQSNKPIEVQLPPLPDPASLKDTRGKQKDAIKQAARAVPRNLSNVIRVLPGPDPRPLLIGRERELESLIRILLSRFKPNVILLGDPGVGKTALVEELAVRISGRNVPLALRGCTIFEVSAGSLMAGMSRYGELEERLQDLVRFLETTPGAVLFLDEIHALVRPTSMANPLDLLKPALGRGTFRCIAATTQAEYYAHLVPDEAFTRRFMTLVVAEPSRDVTLTILASTVEILEKHHGRDLDPKLIERAYTLAERLLPQRRFPDKGIDLLDRAFALAVARGVEDVTDAAIDEAAAEMAGLPPDELLPDSAKRLEQLEERLASRIFGQDRAVQAVANVVRLCKERLDVRPQRPDGVILLAGPTGVGKTALAEALAEALTGSLDHLVRINMSQFSEEHTISQLIGAPPGYVGYSDEPLLVRAATRHPHGVILLDEFEKAHREVLRFFLDLFETGRFTDRLGRRHSLSNATIVATCNYTPGTRRAVGFAGRHGAVSERIPDVAAALGQMLTLELVNRFDEIVVLDPIGRETAREILEGRILPDAVARLEAEHDLTLELDPSAEEVLLERGHSEALGVRELNRAVQDLLLTPLVQLVHTLERPARVRAAAGSDGRINLNSVPPNDSGDTG